LVLSTLGRIGSPLLRYRTGDLVRVRNEKTEARGVQFPRGERKLSPGKGGIPCYRFDGNPCKCGRYELALEGGILGRVDDMVIVRGVNVYPSAVDEIVRSCGGIAEYQVEISNTATLPELSVQIEPRPDCSDLAAVLHKLE